ncbi:hypothetical protein GLOTRDRAFT_137965 [Gloeophyllum trabeum ATCC 11539]|uniref:Uncharacterized protein n=1 Tax=Gloeophyllum trabeum (strain ATCC 11539 / FP-39264 / Madison 617) TaxID=670483 RepID=S7RNQ5_GLOTA|nr:uncharacterized protein GLOTRDRAFT_137965 [Gloeophyllum trabeum ATCC 11539]EPQ56140.1 hypothetical protein GLOTRDRAFT_137965 [Gloeophyllum trabeum ATCC 11539]
MAYSPARSRSSSPSPSPSPLPPTPSFSFPAPSTSGCQPPPPSPNPAPSTPRRHVRKRRSSLSLNVSSINASLGQLKSPQRSVDIAMQRQRQLLVSMSPGRSRSATVAEGAMGRIKEEGSPSGRARASTLFVPARGAMPVLRTRRKLRLQLAPALPPPNSPLPPIPSQQAPASLNRQPFAPSCSPNALPVDSPVTLDSNFTDKLFSAMSMSQSPIEQERAQWDMEAENGD